MAKSASGKSAKTGKDGGKVQTFFFSAPTATSVQLVGDFTHWQQAPIGMKKNAHGIWQASVELPPGQHRYRFVVDGQWRDDPESLLRTPNPYGGQDSIRHVN